MDDSHSGPRRHRRLLRMRWVLALTTVLGLLLLDGLRPPQRQAGAAVALVAIDVYQRTASRWLGRLGARCRFEPSCSHYGELAIRNRGLIPGTWLIARRIARCGPWTPAGTLDPPPSARAVSPLPASSADG